MGEIDPAGESIKLATLGLRPMAVALLWNSSFEYKKKEDWDGLSATLNQITKLEPNFITVWEHQSHNLAYNVSVEFDDYRMRYHWVTKGIDFLVDGVHLNRENPRLLHYTGWIMGQKIGRANEHCGAPGATPRPNLHTNHPGSNESRKPGLNYVTYRLPVTPGIR